MPLLLHQMIAPEGELGLWQVKEPEEWFLDRLDLAPQEAAQFSTLKGRRRVEWLAVRQLVHDMSGREERGAFIKDEHGKPHLENSRWEISVSHSRNLAAAIAAPRSVGIDIQVIVEKIGRIAHRFMRPEELHCLSAGNRLEHMHVFWGAKEAIYKAYGRRQLDFSSHILVDPFDFDAEKGMAVGHISREGLRTDYRIHYEKWENYILVWVIEADNPG